MSEQQGLIVVHTGNGKGKTTAALGLGMRAWGQGLRVLIIQFIKGSWKYGELKAAEQLGSRFVMRPMGEGFVTNADSNGREGHEKAAREAFQAAEQELVSGNWDMIILDEINYAIKFGLVSLDKALELIDNKPASLHLIMTGRDAQQAVIDKADLVTEMKEIKHPYKKGIKAQKGIEF